MEAAGFASGLDVDCEKKGLGTVNRDGQDHRRSKSVAKPTLQF